MFIPNLFILGAAKSGTTTLHNFLSNYEDTCMANPKEPVFFELEYDKGLEYYRKKYFANYNNEKFIGDSRHRNLFLPFVPERIFETNPNAKLIIILRNPVDRAYAHWWHFYSRGIEKKSFSKKIKEETKLFSNNVIENVFGNIDKYASVFSPKGEINTTSYILSSIYSIQIERYYKLFNKKQILIIDFDDIKSVNNTFYNNLLYWIYEDNRKIISVNFDNKAKLNDLRGSALLINEILKPVKTFIPDLILKKIKHKVLERPQIKDNDKKFLIEFFKPFNQELKTYIDFDINKWEKI